MAEPKRRVIFVCWGNICRSPMAERVAEKLATDRDLDGVVFSSAATSTEVTGAPIDPRAVAVLRRHGYRTGDHAAHRVTRDEIEAADLGTARLLQRIHRCGPPANLHCGVRQRAGSNTRGVGQGVTARGFKHARSRAGSDCARVQTRAESGRE